jgi:hypothetical protein
MLRILLCLIIPLALASTAELPAGLFVAAPPADAKPVTAAKAAAKPGEVIVVRGYVGGRAKPIADGRALFTIVDGATAPQCGGPDDHCPTPWDACCADKAAIAAGSATVQIAADDGKPLAAVIDGVNGFKPGATVVVAGTVAASSSEKVLIISATAIHVEAGK